MIRVNVVATSHRPWVSEFGHVEAQTSPSTWACMRRRSVEEATRTSSIVAYPTACPGGSNSEQPVVVGKLRRQAACLCSVFSSVQKLQKSECTRASSEFSSRQFTTSSCVLWRLNRCKAKQSEAKRATRPVGYWTDRRGLFIRVQWPGALQGFYRKPSSAPYNKACMLQGHLQAAAS